MTFKELTKKVSDLGSLQSEVEIWTTNGIQYKIAEVYIDEGHNEDENVVVFDIEQVR